MDSNAKELSALLDTFGLLQHVKGPTHTRGHTLDLVISKGVDISSVDVKDLALPARWLRRSPKIHKWVAAVPLPTGMLAAELNWTEKGTNQFMKWFRSVRSLKRFVRSTNTFATDTTLPCGIWRQGYRKCRSCNKSTLWWRYKDTTTLLWSVSMKTLGPTCLPIFTSSTTRFCK